ncbi:gene transfer agent family protein [Novosphingobium mathurense]|uniref:Phage tail tube protein, GTA-gp10 n=1 Tax=Novosphingobium mathurense TaxID=428990 RepID=A0A1U6HF04_9SPHN|nr:gene transfer agent family protein [Novosphingobium mathurense]SLJ94300.1 Phage tail tube protein, GTA-gp10 [Novosphingobium mathurense]
MKQAEAEHRRTNPLRGEAAVQIDGTAHVLRPTFGALVAAEEELGPLFALVERAGAGELRLSELATLFWHCLADRQALTREALGEAIARCGLAACTGPLRTLLSQILKGSG